MSRHLVTGTTHTGYCTRIGCVHTLIAGMVRAQTDNHNHRDRPRVREGGDVGQMCYTVLFRLLVCFIGNRQRVKHKLANENTEAVVVSRV